MEQVAGIRWLVVVALAAVCSAQERRELVTGHVLDSQGRPVAGIQIGQRLELPGEPSDQARVVATTDAHGSFTASLGLYRGSLLSLDVAWATLVACKLGGPVDRDYVVVVAPAMSVHGRVVDARGRPVSDAEVVARLDPQVRATLPPTLEEAPEVLAKTVTDRSGAFVLTRVPAAPDSTLEAKCEPLAPASVPIASEVEIVLRDPLQGVLVEGVVLDPDGRPAEGASMRLGDVDHARSGADGRFRLLGQWPLPVPRTLLARHEDYQPVIVRDFEVERDAQGMRAAWVELKLTSRFLSISGTVFDASGQPVLRGLVRVWDPTHVVGESREPWSVIESHTAELEGGRFRLERLMEREYLLDVVAFEPYVQFRSQPVRAGRSDVELRVPADAFTCRISGRVRAPDGTRLAHAQVAVTFREPSGRVMWPLDSWWEMARVLPQTWCDAEGRFELQQVACKLGVLIVSGDELIPQAFDIASIDSKVPVALVVHRVARLRIEGLDPQTHWLEFALLDGQGEQARQRHQLGPDHPPMTALLVENGVSAELPVAEGAYRLSVTVDGKKLITAREVELVAGETLVVEP